MLVKRLKTDCCGMLKDGVYEAEETTEGYIRCRLADKTFTSPHWAGFGSSDPWFEIVDDQRTKDERRVGNTHGVL